MSLEDGKPNELNDLSSEQPKDALPGRELGIKPCQKDPVDFRLSRIVLKAAKNGKLSLLTRLTAGNKEKITSLLGKPPKFYREDPEAAQQIDLDPYVASLMPQEFFDHPTQWIERQPNISRSDDPYGRLPSGKNIRELQNKPYDRTKVKMLTLDSKDHPFHLVSKRLEPEKLDEVDRAHKAFEVGIPTPRVLGHIMDQGNTYVFFEHIPSLNLLDIVEQTKVGDFYNGPDHAISTHLFQGYISNCQSILRWAPQPNKLKRQLYKIWHSALPNILVAFLSSIMHEHADCAHELRNKFQSEVRDYPEIFAIQNFNKLGFEDLEDFLASYPYIPGHQYNQNLIDRATKKLVRFLETIDTRSRPFRQLVRPEWQEWRACVSEGIFGCNLIQEIEKLKSLCKEKGVEHKDFALRNILMEWDTKKNKPHRPNGKPVRLLLIDWEPAPASGGP